MCTTKTTTRVIHPTFVQLIFLFIFQTDFFRLFKCKNSSTRKASMASDTNCHNMVSNLPLLFAGGYPTSLEKITESQLEKFIPFMVQCSLGNIQIHNNTEYSEPEWWPENVPFSIPLQRPVCENEWHDKLKSIVIICYKFHSSIFLLRFCQQLATYQAESLRFINNYNNTTSLFERSSNKLLVTFRNENMVSFCLDNR